MPDSILFFLNREADLRHLAQIQTSGFRRHESSRISPESYFFIFIFIFYFF